MQFLKASCSGVKRRQEYFSSGSKDAGLEEILAVSNGIHTESPLPQFTSLDSRVTSNAVEKRAQHVRVEDIINAPDLELSL